VAQKQYAIDLCTKDWVLLLDADEEVSPSLAEEIRAAIARPNPATGYRLPRKNLFLGRWMRYGGFYPDPKLRLFRRGKGFVSGHDPHDRCELKPELPGESPQQIQQFKHALIHYTYPTLTLYLSHMNRYSSLGAQLAVAKGHRSFSSVNIVLRPLATFIYNYFIRLGFLDGREGLLLHLYHAGYVSWKYAKAWELSRKQLTCRTSGADRPVVLVTRTALPGGPGFPIITVGHWGYHAGAEALQATSCRKSDCRHF
jgi:hypothetical protein